MVGKYILRNAQCPLELVRDSKINRESDLNVIFSSKRMF